MELTHDRQHIPVTNFDSIEEMKAGMLKDQLQNEAIRLGLSKSGTKSDIAERLLPYALDKREYQRQLSEQFCRDNDLDVRSNLSSQDRRYYRRHGSLREA